MGGGEYGRPDSLLGGELTRPFFLGGDPELGGDFATGDLELGRRGGEPCCTAEIGDRCPFRAGDLIGEREYRR